MLEIFVFTATLAQFIEFPVIQDLIYTKICLQTLSQHKFDTKLSNISSTSASIFSNLQGTPIAPSSNGRIQELDVSKRNATSIVSITELIPSNKVNSFSLCNRMNSSNVPRDIRQEISDANSVFWLKYQLIICSLCALASPYWGAVSDKIGRIIPINVPVLASLFSNLISLMFGLLISLDSYKSPNKEWLFWGAIIVGLSGGQVVFISNSFSFLGDNTSSDNRTKRVTILESVIFLAHSLGFYTSKLLMSSCPMEPVWKNKHIVAFGTCAVLNFFCLLYSIFNLRHRKFHRFLNNFEREQREVAAIGVDEQVANLPSNLNQKNNGRNPATSGERLRELTASTPDDLDGPVARADNPSWSIWDILIIFRYYKDTYAAAVKPREFRAIVLLLLFAGFISALNLATMMSLFFVYVKMDPFNWTTDKYSQWNFISSISRGIALIALTLGMKFYSGWNVPDPLVATLGFISKALGLLLIGLAQDSILLYSALICSSLSEYALPPIRSLLSKLVVNDELCKIYTCLGSLQSVCFILGNIAFYVASYKYYNAVAIMKMSFIVTAAFEFGAAIIMLIIYISLRRRILVT